MHEMTALQPFFYDNLRREKLEKPLAEYVSNILANGPETFRRIISTEAEIAATVHSAAIETCLPPNKLRFVGDYYLIMTGMYPQYFHARWLRGAPSIEYYEARGANGYAIAAGKPSSFKPVYLTLSKQFHTISAAIRRSTSTNPLHVSTEVQDIMLCQEIADRFH